MKRWRPYAFGYDNPMRFADGNGMNPGDSTGGPGEIQEPPSVSETVNADGSTTLGYAEVTVTGARKKPKSGWGKFMDFMHGALDVVGTIDPFGIADGLNALIYVAEGDYKNAALSAIGIIPFGDFAKGLKYTDEVVDVVGDVVKYGDEVEEVAEATLKYGDEVEEVAKEGERVFWSGGNTAKNAAETYAKANGKKTLEMTMGGKIMTKLNPILPRSISSPIWNKMSRNFANGARGSTKVFHNATDGVRLNSVWRTKEYPILKSNNVNILYQNIFR
jgi:hypothetical protein